MAIAGGHVEEADGNGQEDYDSMEKAALVAKLKQVSAPCSARVTPASASLQAL